MINPIVQRLLERVVNSPIKLQLLLLYHEHSWMERTPSQITELIYRDIWSTRVALCELAEDGVLAAGGGGPEPIYRYQPRSDLAEAINSLVHSYNEPLEREHVQRALREVASYTTHRYEFGRAIPFWHD